MFKLVSCLVASSIVLAPMLPARADFGYRSSGFGVTIGSPRSVSSFGRKPYGYVRQPYGYRSGYGRDRVLIRKSIGSPYSNRPYRTYPYGTYPSSVYAPGIYSPGFPRSTVIVAPKVRTVILNPGYNRYRNDQQNCGSVIYGSPVVSPIPVNPYTGLACR